MQAYTSCLRDNGVDFAQGFYHLLHADNRMISDVVTSIIGHGLATRFPELRIMPVENGSAWVRPLVQRMPVAA